MANVFHIVTLCTSLVTPAAQHAPCPLQQGPAQRCIREYTGESSHKPEPWADCVSALTGPKAQTPRLSRSIFSRSPVPLFARSTCARSCSGTRPSRAIPGLTTFYSWGSHTPGPKETQACICMRNTSAVQVKPPCACWRSGALPHLVISLPKIPYTVPYLTHTVPTLGNPPGQIVRVKLPHPLSPTWKAPFLTMSTPLDPYWSQLSNALSSRMSFWEMGELDLFEWKRGNICRFGNRLRTPYPDLNSYNHSV